MTDTATLQARLAEAETALHQLEMGQRVVKIATEGESVEYGPADVKRLSAYVARLKRQLGLTPRAGAIGVAFR